MNRFNTRTLRSRLDRLRLWALIAALAAPVAGLALLAAAALTPASAQVQTVDIGSGRVGSVRVTQGRSQTLETSREFVDLVVGDPEIADVMPLTDRTSTCSARSRHHEHSVFDASKQLVGVIEVEVDYNTPRLAADLDRCSEFRDAGVVVERPHHAVRPVRGQRVGGAGHGSRAPIRAGRRQRPDRAQFAAGDAGGALRRGVAQRRQGAGHQLARGRQEFRRRRQGGPQRRGEFGAREPALRQRRSAP